MNSLAQMIIYTCVDARYRPFRNRLIAEKATRKLKIPDLQTDAVSQRQVELAAFLLRQIFKVRIHVHHTEQEGVEHVAPLVDINSPTLQAPSLLRPAFPSFSQLLFAAPPAFQLWKYHSHR